MYLQKEAKLSAEERALSLRSKGTLRPRLFRLSRSSQGLDLFTRLPLGISSLRKCLPSSNGRLPEYLQLFRPTAHVGRNSFVSISMNEKVSSELVAIGSKHKDPKTLMGYIEPSSMSMMAASLAIGNAAKYARKRSSCELDDDEESEFVDSNDAISSDIHGPSALSYQSSSSSSSSSSRPSSSSSSSRPASSSSSSSSSCSLISAAPVSNIYHINFGK